MEKFNLVEKIAVISKKASVSTEVNIIKWFNREEKYDIRTWQGDKPLKGIALSVEELKRILDELDI